MHLHITVVKAVGYYYYFAKPQRVNYRHYGHLLIFFFKSRLYFFRAVLDHSKIEEKVQMFPYTHA